MRGLLHFILGMIYTLSVTSLYAADMKVLENEFSDSVITTKITSKYTESKHLNPLKITVKTNQGVVQLSGYVKNRPAMIEALRLAKKPMASNLLTQKIYTLNA